jgi:hypothetical protein
MMEKILMKHNPILAMRLSQSAWVAMGLMVFGSKLGQDSMLTDDDSFEEQFQGEVSINVTAPAGKLGNVRSSFPGLMHVCLLPKRALVTYASI